MSHKIENNMMAFCGATPWHGLGVDVSADGIETLSRPEMVQAWLKTAGLDWVVQRRSIAMRDAQGQGLLTDPLKGFRAIVRQDTDEVFQVATNRYHPLQNQQIVEFFAEYCTAGNATLETLIGLEGGRKIVALAKLTGADTTIGASDELRGYMMLATSHDGSMRTIGMPTQVRVVCWNTLMAALGDSDKETTFRLKHSSKWTAGTADRAKKIMGMAIEQLQETNELARELSQVQIDERGRLEFITRLLADGKSVLEAIVDDSAPQDGAGLLNAVIADSERDTKQEMNRVGKAILEAMLESPGADLDTARNTLWGAVNGVTYFADHQRGRTQDTRLSASWFGQGQAMKRQAVNVARDMAGIAAR